MLLAVVLEPHHRRRGPRRIGAGEAPTGGLNPAAGWAVAASSPSRWHSAPGSPPPWKWPTAWTYGIAEPVNRAVDWMTDHLYSGVPFIGGTADWAGHFTTWVLDPVRDGLQCCPGGACC
ncbi:hypothetical protein Srut_57290 [Streptomyces rutgersensis]|nr:hypothetical protein Srut_57290 [Streptomyces rutgersensis]